MENVLPKDVQDGLDAARIAALKKASRLKVEAGLDRFKVLRLWRSGFAVEAGAVPPLRGFVDLYDGENHLYQCLIVASEEEAGEMRYEFKRMTAAATTAAVDYAQDPAAPVGLIAPN